MKSRTNLKEKVHGIIHVAAASAGAVGGGLAQLPMADHIPINAIQIAMITEIARAHGRPMVDVDAPAFLGMFAAMLTGRTISEWLVGWIPFWGNAINATTAATLTEAVGWAAHAYFEDFGPDTGKLLQSHN